MRDVRVKRVITIDVITIEDKKFLINVTDDQAAVRYGDTIVWDVQGVGKNGPVVSVGNFERLDPAPMAHLVRGHYDVRPPKFPIGRVTRTRVGWQFEAKNVALGIYKYDILFDGVPVLDPELEIRGPKGG